MVLFLAYKNFYAALYLSQYIISGSCTCTCSHFHLLLNVRQSGFANYTAQYTCIKDQLKQCRGIDRYIPRDLCHAPAPIIPARTRHKINEFSFYLHVPRSSLSSSFSCRTLCHLIKQSYPLSFLWTSCCSTYFDILRGTFSIMNFVVVRLLN